MSQQEFRKKAFITLLAAAITVIFSNWGTIYFQKVKRDQQVSENTLAIKRHELILNQKVNTSENNYAHGVIIGDVQENKLAVKELTSKVEEDNQFIIENIIAIKNQLIELNGKN